MLKCREGVLRKNSSPVLPLPFPSVASAGEGSDIAAEQLVNRSVLYGMMQGISKRLVNVPDSTNIHAQEHHSFKGGKIILEAFGYRLPILTIIGKGSCIIY